MGRLSLEKHYPSEWRATESKGTKRCKTERSHLEIHSDSGTIVAVFCLSLEEKASYDVEFWLWGGGELR